MEVIMLKAAVDPERLAVACRRTARAVACGVEGFVAAGAVVLYGNLAARRRARLCLGWALAQQGGALNEVAFDPDEVGDDLGKAVITMSEMRVISAEIITAVESEAKAFVFLRDELTGRRYEFNEQVEFKWEGDWTEGTFVRRVPGRHEFKVKYGPRPSDEVNVAERDVRPPYDPLQQADVYIYGHDPGSSGESGRALAERRLKELIKDAAGSANTGQAPRNGFTDKGKDGKGKDGKGKDGRGKGKEGWKGKDGAKGKDGPKGWDGARGWDFAKGRDGGKGKGGRGEDRRW